MDILEENDVLKLVATDNLQLTQVRALPALIQPKLENGSWSKVVLDLTRIELVDSYGIKLIIGLYKSCEQKNLPLEVVLISPSILKVLRVCNLHQLATIREDSSCQA